MTVPRQGMQGRKREIRGPSIVEGSGSATAGAAAEAYG
jgi:hypothetical protein